MIGNNTVGLSPADITAAFSLPADPPGLPGQWKQLDLAFAPGSFRGGDRLAFGMDRDEADGAGPVTPAAGGNSADLLGGGVLLPQGTVVSGGASFFGTFQGGMPFQGRFFNLIGNGYSQLDGFGFVNAEAAVKAVSKKHKSLNCPAIQQGPYRFRSGPCHLWYSARGSQSGPFSSFGCPPC